MMTMYSSSEREDQARRKLYEQVHELRASLLDMLTLVSASTDPVGTTAAWSRTEQLRAAARDIERQDHIIRRARSIIDGTKDAETAEAAIEELRKWQGDTDVEIAHSKADDVLCDLLVALGAKDVVDEYKKVVKWFA